MDIDQHTRAARSTRRLIVTAVVLMSMAIFLLGILLGMPRRAISGDRVQHHVPVCGGDGTCIVVDSVSGEAWALVQPAEARTWRLEHLERTER